METVKNLVFDSVDLLRNNSIATANFLRPHYPTCVFYFGERSSLYHKELLGDITRGWGGNADYIKFYAVENVDSESIRDVISGKSLNTDDIRMEITDLLSSQNVFYDMTRIALYCILDTTNIKTPEEFSQWYMLVNHIKNVMGVSTLSMLMVILNESLHLSNIAKGITNKIRELYQAEDIGGSNTHLYDSVFILGNRLKNGSFLKIDPQESEYANFNLFADIVLLTNTKDGDYNTRRAQLYGSDKPAITAAYGFVQKPMAEIVMISLTIIVNKLKDLISSQSLDADALMRALKISNGRSAVYDDFFLDIKELLPTNEFIDWLPGKWAPGRTFDEINHATYGCLQMFVEQNHVNIAKMELINRGEYLLRALIDLLSNSLNAAQLIDGISNEVKNTTYEKAETALNTTDRLPVTAAIEMRIKKEIASEFRVITDQAINKAVQQASSCLENFKQVCSELERMFAVGEEGTRKNLTTFYGDKIDRYFNDAKKLNNLFNRILNIKNSKKDMLQILFKELELLFESDPVYKLSFSAELIERLGAIDTEKRAQEFIGQELIKNLGDRISYYSKNIFRTRVFEAYMLNTEGTNNNLLFKYLSERPIPPEVTRTFFNTRNNDMAESMWFYICSIDNLSL